MEKKNFNEVLKRQEEEARLREKEEKKNKPMALDDTQRVKVLSPGRLVFNRFVRNKLAIVGSVILIVMFAFAFIGALIYPYGQTEIFYKYDNVVVDYAMASKRTDYSVINANADIELPSSVSNRLNGTAREMDANDLTEQELTDDNGNLYIVRKGQDKVYQIFAGDRTEVAYEAGSRTIGTYSGLKKSLDTSDASMNTEAFVQAIGDAVSSGTDSFTYEGKTYTLTPGTKKTYTVTQTGADGLQYVNGSLEEGFEQAVADNMAKGMFEFNGKNYSIVKNSDTEYSVYEIGSKEVLAAFATTLVFDTMEGFANDDASFEVKALEAYCGNGKFEANGGHYEIKTDGDEITVTDQSSGEAVAALSDMVVRASNGGDTMAFGFKEAAREAIEKMKEEGVKTATFEYAIPASSLNVETDVPEGVKLPENMEGSADGMSTIKVTNKNGAYSMTCEQLTYLIDIYASPSSEHLLGTDGNGMDVLARMMYGGRVSLMVCFVVVIIQTVLGVIMGGIAGYFGGWLDNLIMRIVDIFYCIPSMPILIIIGALCDSMKMESYVRLIWMMVILGILGWAGVARLVRGQILSLREQEFMVAAESIGLRTSRRIFKHLVPNVMPQLIVTASNALGGIIITESTLSFLGIGVKYPLATWGSIINSVTGSSENMIAYTYIWIPVGICICLTVVAFNFVGDGLRDAFDPKMKR